MIDYLNRNQLDEIKYNNCIKKACNSRIYAYSWYLDIVSDNWDTLVLNDYEAVMPLPWRSKYFIKYIYPPAWTQQLGVFSNHEINADLVQQFVNSIPIKFKKITIQFNSENDVSLLKTNDKVNYILPLNSSYEEIYKGFNKNRKRDLQKLKIKNLTIKVISLDSLIEIATKNYSFLSYTNKEYLKLKSLANFSLEKDKAMLLGVYNLSEKLIGGALFIKDDGRLTYLFSVMDEEGFKNKVPTYLISSIIEKFSKSNYILDFEGSMDFGISRFFKSFGAKSETYYSLQIYGI